MLQVFQLDGARLDRDVAYICKCFILMFAYVCNGYTCVFKFSGVLQVFQLFQTYVASVSSVCCKSRSDVALVAMRVRSGGSASGPCAWSGGAGIIRVVRARVGTRNIGSGRGVLP
jgi:hypothetical protein